MLADVAAHGAQRGLATGGRDRHAEPRDDDGDRPAGGLGGEVGDRIEAVPGENGIEHLQVDGAQALDERRGGTRSALGLGWHAWI